MPDSGLSSFYIVSLNPHNNSMAENSKSHCYCSHVTDEDTEAANLCFSAFPKSTQIVRGETGTGLVFTVNEVCSESSIL